MIILEEHRAIILHIPKCGGKNMRTSFNADNPDGRYWNWRYIDEISQWSDFAHPTIEVLRKLPEWKEFKKYTIIAIVRNPIARFFSAMKEHRIHHGLDCGLEVIADRLDEIRIAHDPRYIHFCPQHRFTHIGNKRYADFIGRIEHLHDDLYSIGTKCHFSQSFFEAVDRISMQDSGGITPSPDLILQYGGLISRLYYRDFLLFGYSLPSIAGRQAATEFEQLVMDPTLWQEWTDSGATRAAYERLRAASALKANNNELLQRLAEVENRLVEMDEEHRRLQEKLARRRRRSIKGLIQSILKST